MHLEVVIGTREELAHRFVADLACEVRASTAGRRFTLAVPGGSVADILFPHLVAPPFEWSAVDVLWTDERAVPQTSPESNFAQAERLWLTPARVPASSTHRMPADGPDLPRAAAAYALTLEALAGSPPRLDYALLGVGADGHVASVFSPEIEPGTPPVTWTESAPKSPPRRMTMSLDTLVRARRVIVAAFDDSKADAVAEAVQERSSSSPVSVLLRLTGRPLLLLSPEAARRL